VRRIACSAVPPVGVEPTLGTLLGGRPLPLGYGGLVIIPRALTRILHSRIKVVRFSCNVAYLIDVVADLCTPSDHCIALITLRNRLVAVFYYGPRRVGPGRPHRISGSAPARPGIETRSGLRGIGAAIGTTQRGRSGRAIGAADGRGSDGECAGRWVARARRTARGGRQGWASGTAVWAGRQPPVRRPRTS
jgi:hypothetical protein